MKPTCSVPPDYRPGIAEQIFARIWALWGLLTFILTFLLIFLPSMLSWLMPEKKGQTYFIAVSRLWMNVWLALIACPVRIRGREHFSKGRQYIVVFNHNALLDVPLSAPYVPGANKTIAKSSFAKVPVFGWFYSRGSVLVDRNNESSRRRSYEKMKAVLAAGIHMCLYPEGTRNRSAEPLKPFYDGAFKLAVETGTDVIPCIITGTRKAMPASRFFYLLPTRLTMQFLPPASVQGQTHTALKDLVFNQMKEAYCQAVQQHPR